MIFHHPIIHARGRARGYEIRRPVGEPAKDGLFELPGVEFMAEFQERAPAVQDNPETGQSILPMLRGNVAQEKAFTATGWITQATVVRAKRSAGEEAAEPIVLNLFNRIAEALDGPSSVLDLHCVISHSSPSLAHHAHTVAC